MLIRVMSIPLDLDEKYLLYQINDRSYPRSDLWYTTLTPDSKPARFSITAGLEDEPRISPDGRYIAYLSNESDQWEVYVTSSFLVC